MLPIADTLWLDIPITSYHISSNSSNKYNERNYGIGIEDDFKPLKNTKIMLGAYKNSFSAVTTYYGLETSFSTVFIHKNLVSLGIMYGVDTGYNYTKSGISPYVMPSINIEDKHIGLRFVFIPDFDKSVHGVFALQLKFKLGN